MGLQFKLSRNRMHKDQYVTQLLFDQLQKSDIDKVYYIIPDNLKFESEVNTLEFIKQQHKGTKAGMIDLQVYSFTRLAWHLLSESVLLKQTRLSQTGLAILVKKILLDLQANGQDLQVYRGQEEFTGFVDKMATLLMELRNGLIKPSDLEAVQSDLDPNSDTYRKLGDLEQIYDLFIQEVSDKYIEQEDIFKALVKYIKSHDFSRTVFVIDHYENFSGQELNLIESLLINAKDVVVNLTLDKPYPNHKPDLIDLFYLPGKTYHTIFKLAQSLSDIPISTDIVEPEAYQNDIHLDILSLEDYWFNQYKSRAQGGQSSISHQAIDRLKVAQLLTPQDEVNYIANEIKHLINSGKYRYKDILVVGRQLEHYANHLTALFNQHEIPTFFDVTDAMSHHPLVEFIISTLRIIKYNFQYEDVMRFLRSELFIPQSELNQVEVGDLASASSIWREKVDQAENVILAYGYEGAAWTRGEEWVYDRIDEEDETDQTYSEQVSQDAANQVRRQIHQAFQPLLETLKQKQLTNGQALVAIYQFALDNNVKERILNWRDQAVSNKEIEASKRHEQAWQTFITVIDEYIEVLGDREWDLDECLSIIEMAFESAEFSNVPPTLDQVTVTQLDQVRTKRHPIVFYIGMNDTTLPQSIDNTSILDDQDREIIQSHIDADTKKLLTPNTSETLAGEAFVAYQAFGFASDAIYFSYSQKQDGESDHNLSPYIRQVMNDLDLTLYKQPSLNSLITEAEPADIQTLWASKSQLLNASLHAKRYSIEAKQPMHAFWAQMAAYFNSGQEKSLQHIFSSLNYDNVPINLGEQLARDLYGQDLHLSVSQLETYYKDPYNHFLKYGLRLKERDLFELTPAESGSFYHDILEAVIQHVIKEDWDIADTSEEEMLRITDEVAQQLLQESRYKILSASNQMQFIKELLISTIERRVSETHRQFSNSDMRPYLTELHFGLGDTSSSLPAYEIPVNNRSTIYLRGKIDRVDLMQLNNDQYLQIVDYKSSSQSMDTARLYAGLSLQLLTYFNAVLRFSGQLNFGQKDLKPLAAVYSVIQVSPINYDNKKDLAEELSKAYKYDGLFVDQQPAILHLDNQLVENYGGSTYYPLRKNKSGELAKLSLKKVIDQEGLALLFKHNNNLIRQAGKNILSGKLEMKPYYEEPYIDTVSGELHAISQFDVLLPKNNYNQLTKFDSLADYLKKLKDEYSGGGEDDGSETEK